MDMQASIVSPTHHKLSAEQRELLLKLHECRAALLQYKKPDVTLLAKLMHMSRATLYRKLKDITGLTPNEWLNEARMKRAAELLTAGGYRAFQVSRLLGYTSQSSFGKMFLKQFKVAPATFQRMEVAPGQSYNAAPGASPVQ